jgi:glycosyltransferase involved in cell wall biosynthesis
MSIDVSIIIPLYNKENFIIDTLKSIRAQDFKNWECIIIDDGSTDSSLKVVTDFCNAHSGNWKIYSVPNGGQTKARNIGISHATGRYLAFLDADDLWVTNKLSFQFNYLEENPGTLGVLSAYAIFKAKSKRVRVIRSKDFDTMLRKWADMSGFGGGLESVGMVRHLEGNMDSLFDENLSTSSGLDFTIRYSKIGRLALLPNIGLLYRLSDGQWHTNSDELMRNSSIIASKFETYFGLNLSRRHRDYFYWIEVRKHGYSFFARMVLSNFLHLHFSRLAMLYWLLSRNIQALIQGRLQQSFVHNEIQKLNS